jgi:Uma2 family endonuclease
VADVAVFTEELTEEYPETPPLIVLEIVSRDDRHTEIVEKLAEYLRWGVRHVWLADPYNLMLHVYGEDGLRQVSSLDLAEYDLRIRREDLF